MQILSNQQETGIRFLTALIKQSFLIKPFKTMNELMDEIFNQINNPKTKTMLPASAKRRIYDIINILISAGFIYKISQNYQWITPSFLKQSQKSEEKIILENRIASKKDRLMNKVRLLNAYKSICNRNNALFRKANSIQLPAIAFGAKNKSDFKIIQNVFLPNKSKIEISLNSNCVIYSSYDLALLLFKEYPVGQLYKENSELLKVINRVKTWEDNQNSEE